MPVTLQQVINAYPGWRIYDLSGGWAAIRTSLAPKGSGLANVRCGKALEELVEHLKAETRGSG
jgi:hypothetical protein